MKLKYLSVDVETTGLDTRNDQLVEVAAILDDFSNLKPIEDLPRFHCYIKRDNFSGNPYALSLHADKFKKISEGGDDVLGVGDFVMAFKNWIIDNNGYYDKSMFAVDTELIEELPMNATLEKYRYDIVKVVGAGKNFGSFDRAFLENSSYGFKDHIKFAHRCIDVGDMYLSVDDVVPPSLDECAERAGLDERCRVNHNAMNEAEMVIKLIRINLLGKFTI